MLALSLIAPAWVGFYFHGHKPGLPRWLSGKEYACQCRRLKRHAFHPWVGYPWSRKWQPVPVFLPGKFHRQRSLVGYSPWGHKESDTAEAIKQTRVPGNPHTHTLHSLTPELGPAEPTSTDQGVQGRVPTWQRRTPTTMPRLLPPGSPAGVSPGPPACRTHPDRRLAG